MRFDYELDRLERLKAETTCIRSLRIYLCQQIQRIYIKGLSSHSDRHLQYLIICLQIDSNQFTIADIRSHQIVADILEQMYKEELCL